MNDADTSIAAMPSEEIVRNGLRAVLDPEVGMNIVDLGLVRAIRLAPGEVEVDLGLTSPACPMGEMLVDEVLDCISSMAQRGDRINVNVLEDFVWDPSLMSPSARAAFGW